MLWQRPFTMFISLCRSVAFDSQTTRRHTHMHTHVQDGDGDGDDDDDDHDGDDDDGDDGVIKLIIEEARLMINSLAKAEPLPSV